MSVDHKPGRKAESRRILRSGGYLDETDPRNPRVVCDSLNVRAEQARHVFFCFYLRGTWSKRYSKRDRSIRLGWGRAGCPGVGSVVARAGSLVFSLSRMVQYLCTLLESCASNSVHTLELLTLYRIRPLLLSLVVDAVIDCCVGWTPGWSGGNGQQMSIATSRALGDFDFKSNPSRQPEEQMISPVPELYTRRRQVRYHLMRNV